MVVFGGFFCGFICRLQHPRLALCSGVLLSVAMADSLPSTLLADLWQQKHCLRLHLLGVAGSGMSGIAQLLLEMGHRVSGSDRATTTETERLQAEGLEFFQRHRDVDLTGVDAVIYSSAIRKENPCLQLAESLQIPLIHRSEALAAILSSSAKGVVVAGTHGKTTTSSMLAYLLRSAEFFPSHYIGAEIPILGCNAHWNSEGDLFVAEGDESDGSLVNYKPAYTVLLNVEADHLDYYSSQQEIDAVFAQLLRQTSKMVLYCRADKGASRIAKEHANAVSYGWDLDADWSAQRVELSEEKSTFTLYKKHEAVGRVQLGIPGRHNVLNALAALALALELGGDFAILAAALRTFQGANRRFQLLGEDTERQIRLVDDYGHHPTEIFATLDTARRTRPQRLLAAFQPHRYTRTQAMAAEFGPALAMADVVWVSDVYPASEDPIEGVSGQTVVDEVQRAGIGAVYSMPSLTQIRWAVGNALQDGDLFVSLGAGNVHEVTRALARDLQTLVKIRAAVAGEPCKLKLYEPMRRHTTLLVGGAAQFWAEPETEAGFLSLLEVARQLDIPVMVVGRGSNLLVLDGGIPGLVIHPARGDFGRIEVDGTKITCGVGARLKAVANAALKAGIGGFEWMEGIPGNVGGALRMNAGAMQAESFDQVESVRLVDDSLQVVECEPAQLKPSYRNVETLRKQYALSAVFTGMHAEERDIREAMERSKQKRKSSQPLAASAGCIFKNPITQAGIGAGQLVDELGLKNVSVGAACVSDVHANFIVNQGGATAKEVMALIEEIKQRALTGRGVHLECEVEVVGTEECTY